MSILESRLRLAFPKNLHNDEVLLPVDMRGVGREDFDVVKEMIEKLGTTGTAAAFVNARDYFIANKDEEPEDERPQPMPAKEWRTLLEDDTSEESSDQCVACGEPALHRGYPFCDECQSGRGP